MTMRKGCCHAPILQYLSSLFTLRLSRRPDPLPPAARSRHRFRSFPSAALRSWSAALPPPARGRAGEGVRICKAIDFRGRPSKFGITRVVDFRRGLSRPADSSCPGLTRASMSLFSICQDVNGRDKPGHDDAERMLPRPQGRSKNALISMNCRVIPAQAGDRRPAMTDCSKNPCDRRDCASCFYSRLPSSRAASNGARPRCRARWLKTTTLFAGGAARSRPARPIISIAGGIAMPSATPRLCAPTASSATSANIC